MSWMTVPRQTRQPGKGARQQPRNIASSSIPPRPGAIVRPAALLLRRYHTRRLRLGRLLHSSGAGLRGAAILIAAAAGSAHRADDLAVDDERDAAFHRDGSGETQHAKPFSAGRQGILKRFGGAAEQRGAFRLFNSCLLAVALGIRPAFLVYFVAMPDTHRHRHRPVVLARFG